MTELMPFAEERPQAFHARLTRRAVPIAARQRIRHRGHRLAVLAVAIAVPAFAAPGDWSGDWPGDREISSPFPQVRAEKIAPMAFETPGDSFPGSAFYYLADEPYQPQPAASDARTSDALAPDAHWDAEPAKIPTGPAARPLIANGTAANQGRALKCLTQAIYYEAASESDAGQRAVAQVVLNRVAHNAYPNSVCGVVFQGSARRTGCQFSFTCDGSMSRQPSRLGWSRARAVANAALAGAVYAPVGLATHYHTVQIHPYWADSLVRIGTIGAHRFYRWGGQAGKSAAFRAAYSGSEPSVSAPTHASSPGDISAGTALAVAASKAGEHAKPQSDTRSAALSAPAYTSPVTSRGGDTQFVASRLPQSGNVRPEFAQSGQWIDKSN